MAGEVTIKREENKKKLLQAYIDYEADRESSKSYKDDASKR